MANLIELFLTLMFITLQTACFAQLKVESCKTIDYDQSYNASKIYGRWYEAASTLRLHKNWKCVQVEVEKYDPPKHVYHRFYLENGIRTVNHFDNNVVLDNGRGNNNEFYWYVVESDSENYTVYYFCKKDGESFFEAVELYTRKQTDNAEYVERAKTLIKKLGYDSEDLLVADQENCPELAL